MIRSREIVRESRDAVIAETFGAGRAAANPYGPTSKRHIFWQHGADQARAAATRLLQIGA
ncbi:hypothetical protein [Novosphingobium sp. P6W]|uniref:hypothetical protein n=1 Tax=Novosphingobium sp. P6W TaxID=1609758 RepID=UPI0005C2C208|nr:hypothetical protein [Novosphingobium sp. P6W]AXB77971.1 hypothetical protein TQ38_002100 [Novosphingobium sp. P6W]KIS32842.1 hypothetical protein TQ38_09310 [Novosphingobium sp. P6W]